MTAASGGPVASAGLEEEEQEEEKPGFCFLLKTWTIYYITLTFALLAIFRFISTVSSQLYIYILQVLWYIDNTIIKLAQNTGNIDIN